MTPEQLKASILQQAMEGKLVKQDPHDEPASKLMKKIAGKKARLIKEKKIKRTKKLPAITDDEKPFDIPDSWEWVRLGNIFDVKGGKRVPRGKRLNTSHQGKPYLRVADMANGSIKKDDLHYADDSIVEQISKYTISSKDLYFSIAGTIGKVGQIPNELNNAQLTENAAKLVAYDYVNVCDEYFVITLESNLVRNQHKTMLKQMAQPKLALFRLKNTLIPLPPLSEQKRIVAKIEKLMPLVDKYAESYNQLAKIDANFNDRMKQSILQYAMEGKLVKQDPHDEPASVLVKKSAEEKARLIKEKKIKRTKKLPEITDDEKPFEIPDSWEWVRMSDVLDVRDGTHDSPKYIDNGIPLITSKNISNGYLDFSNVKYISQEDADKINERSSVDDNDIIFAMIGTIGNPIIIKKDREFAIKNVALLKHFSERVYMPFILQYMWVLQAQFNENASGAVQKFVSLKKIRQSLIPLPPLAEQKRIVAKLDQLMSTIH